MIEKDANRSDPVDLRRRAEEQLRKKPADFAAIPPEEAGRLLHELQVHQIELEMQNEELRRAQKELAASRVKYFDLYDMAPVGYFTVSEKGLILEANLTADILLGVAQRALAKEFLTRFILTEDQDIYYRHSKQLFKTGEPHACVLRMVKKDGIPFWARLDATVAQGVDGAPVCRAVLKDITERKRAEEALRESEDRFRDLVEHCQDLLCTHDLEGRILSVNPWAATGMGYAPEELLRMNFRDLLVPEVRHEFERYLDEIRTHGTARGLMWVQTRKGERRFLEYRNTLRTEGVAEPIVRGMAQDITERKRMEQELRESETRYRSIFNSSSDGIVIVDPDTGTMIDFNQQACTQLGYTREEFGCMKISDIEILENQEEVNVHIQRIINTGYDEFETLHRTKLGEQRNIHVKSRYVLIGGKSLYHCVWRDITDRKNAEVEKEKLQGQLQQSMKMEAIGRLAGGVAHDFNNLLTVITGYSEFLLQKMGKESPMHKEVEEIQRAAERAALLTQQLLAFSRKQIIEPKIMDLNLLTANVGKMLVRLIGENIDLKTVHGKGLGQVKVDPGQFDQVLINLAVNARDAMPDGGTLLIETANVELDEEYCAGRPYKIRPGRFVMLAVSDTGHGMTKEVTQQIFEPFFTTKEQGKGTGLGLSMVYGAVKQSGGSIEAYSEVGIGTTFKIYLPRVEEEAAKQVEDDRPKDLPGGAETVLLVEDEDMVRNLCARILGDLGYKVMQARNGAEAVAAAQKYGERIDLLLTDVVMPGMNGGELATQLVLHHPEMKVLFTSGYTDDAIVRHGVLDEGVSFIGKPYAPLALARKVREVLDGK